MAALRARIALTVTVGAQVGLMAVFWNRPASAHNNLMWALLALLLFAASLWLLARCALAPRVGVLLIVGVGALLQLVALTAPPRTSDDDFRYVWDGTVQLHGVDPYRYPPTAPQLAHLRSPFLFGSGGHCVDDVCTRINHPGAHTIYPPVAEAAFTAIQAVAPPGHLPLQVAAALGAVAIAALLGRRVLARGDPPWPLAIWAWCPVTFSEFGNNAHIDWLGVLFVILALSARRSGPAGALLGAAIATKLYPVLVLPVLLRRRPLVVIGAATGVLALSYLPHVLAVGRDVIGFLPGYLREEHYVNGDRLELLGLGFGHPFDTLAALALLGWVARWAWRRADPSAPERAAVIVVGAAFLVATPNYGWYATLLLALVVMSGSVEWLPVALAPTVTYLYRAVYLHTGIPSSVIYLVAGILTGAWWMHRRADRAEPVAVVTSPRDVVTGRVGSRHDAAS
jgi:hypothetical protein